MTIPDWLGYKVAKAILWLNPLAYLAGIAISIWAWRATRKTGYLVFALYFLLTALGKSSLSVLRIVSGPPNAPALTAQQQQQYTQEMTTVDKRYFPVGHPVAQSIGFPLGSIILVAGLWVLVKRDVKGQTQQTDSAAGTPSGQLG